MKVHFDGLRRPARVAKILRAELANAGIKVGLAKAQDIAARGYGYASYRELQSLAGRAAPSQWDEDCPAHVRSARRERQAAALVEAGMSPAAAASAVERVRPSGRTLTAPGAERPAPGGGQGGKFLSEFAVALVSGPGGRFPLDPAHAQFVAALEDGTLVLSMAHADTSAVAAAVESLLARGFERTRTALSSLEGIRYLYEVAAREVRQPAMTDVPGFHDLIARAAVAGSTRVVAIVRPHGTVVNMVVDGGERLLAAMRREDGMRLCEAAFALAGVAEGAYDPTVHVGARITPPSAGLPDSLQSVILQSNPLAGGGVGLVLGLRYSSVRASPDAGIEALGFSPSQAGILRRMGRRPFGVNVVAGPLGSGKTTTLRRMAGMAQDGRGAIVVSDAADDQPPVDAGARREAFRRAMGSALSPNPDLVIIEELADADSVGLAWSAAVTGHAVWTTLVAPDAMRALDILRGMGLPDHRLGDATLTAGIVAQRRLRRVCPHCSMSGRDAMRSGRISQLEFACEAEARGDGVRYARAGGCDACEDGMAGRVLVAETLVPDAEFLSLYIAGRRDEAMDRWLGRPGAHSMFDHAAALVASGVLDPLEAERRIGSLAAASRERVEAILGTGPIAA